MHTCLHEAALTSDLQLHLSLQQNLSLPAEEDAGVGVCVPVCRVFQGQTEVSSVQQVFINLCSVSVNLVLFFKLIRAVLIYVDLSV